MRVNHVSEQKKSVQKKEKKKFKSKTLHEKRKSYLLLFNFNVSDVGSVQFVAVSM